MVDPMRISQVSRTLQVPVPTLRRWTREFAEGLSPSARGVGSADRKFQLDDLAFLRRIKMIMAKAEITYDEARKQLGLAAAKPGGGADLELGPPSEEERREVARYVRGIVEEVVAPRIRQIEKLEATVSEQGRQLAQFRALLEEVVEDPSKTGKALHKGFPWTR